MGIKRRVSHFDDEEILRLISEGTNTADQLCRAFDLRGTRGPRSFRALDYHLQRMRRDGKISYERGFGWCVCPGWRPFGD
jgi:hypothetical protein